MFERITFNQNVMGGRACIRGMRITVALVANLVANGMTVEDIIREYPDLEPADVSQAAAYASSRLEQVPVTNDIIVKDPEILGGTPVFRGTRVPYQALLDYLEGGETLEEFLDDFPTVTREAAIAALELGKSLLVRQLG
jgi:uncharacterized protein (DUF433 family)